ncbi:MAG: hypothetical protein NVS9B15_10580 [Acidobacteriaceae bacterium]
MGSLIFAAALAVLAQGNAQIRFDYHFPGSIPPEYHVTIEQSGRATFEEPATETQDAYHSEFQVSPEKANWLYQSAEELNHFSGDYDYKKHKVADTGEKRLSYIQGDKGTQAVYHYSENPQIQQITAWLQGLAVTQEFARMATLHRRFDKLALDADIKEFTENLQGGRATEVASIRPLLQQLLDDPAVLNTARQRIKVLLANPSSQR